MGTQSSSIRMLLIWCLISLPSPPPPPQPFSHQHLALVAAGRPASGAAHHYVFTHNEGISACLFRGNNVKVGGAALPVSEVIKHATSNNSTVFLLRPAAFAAEQEAKRCPAKVKSQRQYSNLHTFCFFFTLVASLHVSKQTSKSGWSFFWNEEEE